MVAMFVDGQDEMIDLYNVTSIDAPYQIFTHLATPFQRRRFFMYQKQELSMVAMFVNRSGRNEQSL